VRVVHASPVQVKPVWLAATKKSPAPQGHRSRPYGDALVPPPVENESRVVDATLKIGMPTGLPTAALPVVLGDLPRLEPAGSDSLPDVPPPVESPPEAPPNPPDNRPTREVRPASLIKRRLPIYPPMARKARVQGVVLIEATVTEVGTLDEINVISGHPMLTPAALDAIREWRYEPATLDGIPTRASVSIRVNFVLHFVSTAQ